MKSHFSTRPAKMLVTGIFFIALFGVCLTLVCLSAGTNAQTRQGTAKNRRILWPKPAASFDGIRMKIQPDRNSPVITVITVNQGKGTMTLTSGDGSFGCRLRMFDLHGNRLPYTAAEEKKMAFPHSRSIYLAPGKYVSRTFDLHKYYKFVAQGVYYVYASRLVIRGKWDGGSTIGMVQKYVWSPILMLRLREGMPPVWKIVNSIPTPKPVAKAPVHKATPPYTQHMIPKTGPVAILAEIVQAVHADKVSAVKALCLPEKSVPQPLIMAMAMEAVNLAKLRAAVLGRFGVDWCKGMERLHPSPAGFSLFLDELNLHTLMIRGNEASVGTVYYNGKAFVSFPGFDFCFRKIKGHWFLDSWATYRHISTPAQYLQNVHGDLREARLFNSLVGDIKSGRFASLKEFARAANQQLAAEDDWFTLQSMKNNKQWMKDNAPWVKQVKNSEQAAKKKSPQTQP